MSLEESLLIQEETNEMDNVDAESKIISEFDQQKEDDDENDLPEDYDDFRNYEEEEFVYEDRVRLE